MSQKRYECIRILVLTSCALAQRLIEHLKILVSIVTWTLKEEGRGGAGRPSTANCPHLKHMRSFVQRVSCLWLVTSAWQGWQRIIRECRFESKTIFAICHCSLESKDRPDAQNNNWWKAWIPLGGSFACLWWFVIKSETFWKASRWSFTFFCSFLSCFCFSCTSALNLMILAQHSR